MFSKLRNIKKNWFTMVETIMVLSLFSIVVLWIIWAINRSYSFLGKSKLQVRATNLAREWVEDMFIIRDSNRRRRSWLKDQHWLNTYMCDGTPSNQCKNFEKWLYLLKEEQSSSWSYIKAEKLEYSVNCYSEDEFFKDNCETLRGQSKVIFTWEYTYLSWEAADSIEIMTWNIADLLWWETDFYRLVRVYGIYQKNDSQPNTESASSTQDSAPQELRFCVKVFYWNYVEPHAVELCSMMTNFEE